MQEQTMSLASPLTVAEEEVEETNIGMFTLL